ncbi:MAG: CopG family transcriptional regulator [Candidatus Acididesulfobacter guangdongensis]|uniref:CopG family transcriptional regulator n=1 Tax=Acididesulfobacter guangdongensis TaxID=2597225 RepID=A0A519BIN4_ACIG2|nr:MAG: CopG family transcriptional regulator [Candidatus Acididesulfobacter guangdongensis]
MKKNILAKTTEEFDRRFDEGEDITDLIDISKSAITRGGKKVRLTIDVSASLVQEIDDIRMKIGVDRGALVKIWLYERVKQEKGVQ